MLRIVAAFAVVCALPRVARAEPKIDKVVLALDDGAVVVHGHGLAGMQAKWHGGATCDQPEVGSAGDDICRFPATGAETEWPWLPAAAAGSDGSAALVPATLHELTIDRVELAMLVRPDAVIDAFSAGAAVPLRHAERIADVDCAPAACVVDGDGLLVSNVPAGATSLAVRVRLAPRVVLRRGDAVESSPVLHIPIARCPLAVASGAPLRDVDAQTVVVKLGGRCARELDALHFQIAGQAVEPSRVAPAGDASYVALRAGRLGGDTVVIAAMLARDDGVVAQVRAATRAAPVVHVALALAGRAIDYVPTNVAAAARATAADWDGPLAIAPIDGVYSADAGPNAAQLVRGVASGGGGTVALRVTLRRSVPALGDVDLARVAEPVQRSLREATSAAPLLGAHPLVEVLCDAGDGNGVAPIAPGSTAHVAFDRNDSCRLVLHRERLDPALGAQRLELEVDVTRVDGSPRSEARVARHLSLTHDDQPRTLYLRGAESRFDRYSVRLSEDDDGDRGDRDDASPLPSAQWSIVTGRGRARIYATSAIPTGLYRVSDRDHSGILTLNFGVLARATWLDALGREGILCAEAGALTVGLAGDTSATGKSLTQIATVAGFGLSVPIANRALAAETSVNLHAWLEFEPSRALGAGNGDAIAFVFGPSITVGNLGADL
jgi:hypothetical protein|nr:hypothetical protein [Kofleriaceae bacterium]